MEVLSKTQPNVEAKRSDGLEAKRSGLEAKCSGLEAKRSGLEAKRSGLEAKRSGLEAKRNQILKQNAVTKTQSSITKTQEQNATYNKTKCSTVVLYQNDKTQCTFSDKTQPRMSQRGKTQ
ncbi:hypothetical protein Tco_1019436 [Tanacetum coccineum]|uniref:Uncharacterized protein n=1 Tax=Tanacetum coccineum TaxID=301880 RepID=A0ABQ5FX58_9ASTR